MTATANKETFSYIVESVSLDRPIVLSDTPEKSNIYFKSVSIKNNDPDLFLKSILVDLQSNVYKAKRVIVFCRTVGDVNEVFGSIHAELSQLYPTYSERPYAMFHANTEDYIKEFVTNSFSTIHGTVRVLVATIAFGLGIDCKGLQTVIHYGPPASLDDYFQESGRCGRNGKQSVAVLILYRVSQPLFLKA